MPKGKNQIPEEIRPQGLYRLNQFIGSYIPMSPSKWWQGVGDGIYPQPVKLGSRCTCWKGQDLLKLLENGIE